MEWNKAQGKKHPDNYGKREKKQQQGSEVAEQTPQ